MSVLTCQHHVPVYNLELSFNGSLVMHMSQYMTHDVNMGHLLKFKSNFMTAFSTVFIDMLFNPVRFALFRVSFR